MNHDRLRELSDEELLRRAQASAGQEGGRQAASVLLGRHQQRVYVWCLRYVRHHERALDLAQDVLLKSYRSLDSFQGNSRFTSWLFAITRNQCLSELRSPSPWFEDDDELARVEDKSAAADTMLEHAQDEEALLALVKEVLDEPEQNALWMRCVDKMPVDEITLALGLDSASGARGLLQTARRKLRAALERREKERHS